MKKFLAAILLIFTKAMINDASSQNYILGDADENGVVDGIDASLVLTVYAETSVGKESRLSVTQAIAADVNENDIVDGTDASGILSYYAYISVNGSKIGIRDFISDTTTTQAPTTEPVTEPITEAPTEYYEPEYILDNIATEPNVFHAYAGYFDGEILDGNGIVCNYGYGVTYGAYESYLVLALLNNNINNGVLQNTLGDLSEQELKDYQNFLYLIAPIKDNVGHGVDYTNYTLNQEIGNYLNELQNAGNIDDFIRNTWVEGNMPESCKQNPAVAAIVASYDIYHNGSKYLTQEQVDNDILNNAVDEIISKAKGYEYHR